MIAHNWTVICSETHNEPEVGILSLLRVWVAINLEGRSAPSHEKRISVPVDCEVVSSWVRSAPQKPARATVRAQELNAEGSVLASVEYPVDLTKVDRTYTVAKMSTLTIRGLGRYAFRVHVKQEGSEKWQQVAKVYFDVSFEQTASSHQDG